jgi:mitochondrial fission protein ELM1
MRYKHEVQSILCFIKHINTPLYIYIACVHVCTHVSTLCSLAFKYSLLDSREGPTLVVACGRDTVSISSSIRRLAPESVFVIQVH